MSEQHKVLHFTKNKLLQSEIIEDKIKKDKVKQDKKFRVILSLATGLGLSIALPIAGGAFLGNILDRKLDSSPRITLSLILSGIFIGIANIYQTLKKIEED